MNQVLVINKTQNIEVIPDAVPKGDFRALKLSSPTILAFDLETTDLIRGHQIPQITQMAAYECMNEKRSFMQYVLPTETISPGAQGVTGLCFEGGQLKKNGVLVSAVDIKTALKKFSNWLEKFPNAVLLAHNGRKFDFPVLCEAMQGAGCYETFKDKCTFADSLPLFRKHLPGKKSYKQEDLVKDIIGEEYGAHDALEDVRALGRLVVKTNLSSTSVIAHSFSCTAVYNRLKFNQEKARNLPSLSVLVYSTVCKAATTENIAGSGLNLMHLKMIFARDGEDGLRNIFIMKNSDGQPRVTNTKRVSETLVPKLAEFFKNRP